jgi:hypothetical protein
LVGLLLGALYLHPRMASLPHLSQMPVETNAPAETVAISTPTNNATLI